MSDIKTTTLSSTVRVTDSTSKSYMIMDATLPTTNTTLPTTSSLVNKVETLPTTNTSLPNDQLESLKFLNEAKPKNITQEPKEKLTQILKLYDESIDVLRCVLLEYSDDSKEIRYGMTKAQVIENLDKVTAEKLQIEDYLEKDARKCCNVEHVFNDCKKTLPKNNLPTEKYYDYDTAPKETRLPIFEKQNVCNHTVFFNGKEHTCGSENFWTFEQADEGITKYKQCMRCNNRDIVTKEKCANLELKSSSNEYCDPRGAWYNKEKDEHSLPQVATYSKNPTSNLCSEIDTMFIDDNTISEYTFSGYFIKKWPGKKSICKEYGFHRQTLEEHLAGKTSTICGRVFKYENKVGDAVLKLSLDGKIIEEYKNIADAHASICSINFIHIGTLQDHLDDKIGPIFGFNYIYKQNYVDKQVAEQDKKVLPTTEKSKGKMIFQFTPDGKFIRLFPSIESLF